MIKQLLTAALLALSLNTTPKRSISSMRALYGDYDFSVVNQNQLSWDTPFGINYSASMSFDGSYVYSWQDYQEHPNFGFQVERGEDYVTFHLKFAFESGALRTSFANTANNWSISSPEGVDFDGGDYDYDDEDGYWYDISLYADTSGRYSDVGFVLTIPGPTIYNVSKNFNNCHNSGNSSFVVPDEFTSSTLANPYTIYVLANDGYFFKRDGSSYSFSSGVVVSNVDYGANPSGEPLVYSSEMKITFSMPASDVSMTFTASAISLADANNLYNQGYQDAKAIYENTNQFAWLKNIWSGMAGFFAIEILPNISLGFLAFAPLLVVAIIAIVRIMKHD